MELVIRNAEFLERSSLQADRCTDDAIEILQATKSRALKIANPGIIPDTLLLRSMVLWEKTVATSILAEIVGSVTSLLINHDVDSQRHAPKPVFDFSDIRIAYDLAKGSSSEYVGSQHLLIGLLDAGGRSASILQENGVTTVGVRSLLKEML
jgi:hypothetical protein